MSRRSAGLIVALGLGLGSGCTKEDAVATPSTAVEPGPAAKVEPEETKASEPDAAALEAETDRVLAERLAEAEAKLEGLEVQQAKAVEPRTPVEPKLGPMSRPESKPLPLPAPPFAAALRRQAPVRQGPEPTLKKVSDVRNGVTDVDVWLSLNGLRLPTWELPNEWTGAPGDLPAELTATYQGMPIAEAIDDGAHSIAIHAAGGSDRHHLVVRDAAGSILSALDFSTFASTPADDPAESMFIGQEIQWAQVRDGVLFACTYHRTYAKSSGGLNAFITALELRTGDLLWQSAPLVCNSRNFLVRDGWIVTGYGFTAEPDFLYVLDAKTGEIASKTKVKSGPELIFEKDGQLFVRTYDRDLVFDIR
ncbi:MAG: hypothetical protein AB1Z98_18550 [Nannocystaceae bacterium]